MPGLIDLIFEYNEEAAAKYDFVERDGNTLRIEIFIPLLYGGRGAYLWAVASPLFDEDGRVAGAIESVRDITKRKEMEEELKRHRSLLKASVNERTQQLESRTQELTAVNERLLREIDERRRKEQALRESNQKLRLAEERFRKAFKASPSIMAVSELADGHYLDVNDRFLEATGYSWDELIGHSAFELNIWCDPQERAQMIKTLAQKGTVRNHEAHIRFKDGSIRVGLLSAETLN